jgi:hypothetical protein
MKGTFLRLHVSALLGTRTVTSNQIRQLILQRLLYRRAMRVIPSYNDSAIDTVHHCIDLWPKPLKRVTRREPVFLLNPAPLQPL